jgi:hypothetical protein
MSHESTHGGARSGAGRKKLSSDERRSNVTIKLLPGADAEMNQLANKAASSKGSVIEWLVLSPDAADCRKMCIAQAAQFTRRQPMQKESAASSLSRAALRKQAKLKIISSEKSSKP